MCATGWRVIFSNISCFSLGGFEVEISPNEPTKSKSPLETKGVIFAFMVLALYLISSQNYCVTIFNTDLFYLCNFPPHVEWGIQLVFALLVSPRGYRRQRNASSGLDAILYLLHLNMSLMVLANYHLLKEKKKVKKLSSSYRLTHRSSHWRCRAPWLKLAIQKASKHMYNEVWEQAPWRQWDYSLLKKLPHV